MVIVRDVASLEKNDKKSVRLWGHLLSSSLQRIHSSQDQSSRVNRFMDRPVRLSDLRNERRSRDARVHPSPF